VRRIGACFLELACVCSMARTGTPVTRANSSLLWKEVSTRSRSRACATPSPTPRRRPRPRLRLVLGVTGSGLSVGPETTRSWTPAPLERFSTSPITVSKLLAIALAMTRDRSGDVSVIVTFISTVSGSTEDEIMPMMSSGSSSRPVAVITRLASSSLFITPT